MAFTLCARHTYNCAWPGQKSWLVCVWVARSIHESLHMCVQVQDMKCLSRQQGHLSQPHQSATTSLLGHSCLYLSIKVLTRTPRVVLSGQAPSASSMSCPETFGTPKQTGQTCHSLAGLISFRQHGCTAWATWQCSMTVTTAAWAMSASARRLPKCKSLGTLHHGPSKTYWNITTAVCGMHRLLKTGISGC